MRPLLAPTVAVLAAAAAVLTQSLAIAEPVGPTVTYFNQKYGFSIGVPTGLFEAGNSRQQAEGGLWVSRDGQVRLLVAASVNTAGSTLSAYRSFVLAESYANAQIDYAPTRDTWFVLSGRKGEQIFYERINFICDGRFIYGWQFLAPVSDRKRYEPVIEALHKSYKAGRGEDGRCGRTTSPAEPKQ